MDYNEQKPTFNVGRTIADLLIAEDFSTQETAPV